MRRLLSVKRLITGAGINVKPESVAVPPGVVTLTLPDAPEATTAVILVEEFTTNDVAATPPNLTAVAPVSLLGYSYAPVAPLVGVKEPDSSCAD